MSRDYYKLEPDRFYQLKQHYTVGRAGQKVEFITRHHLMYIGEVEDVVDKIWNTRQASAHVVIGPKGRWGQAVGDSSTAWANATQWANQRTIAIEHSNNTGRFGGNDFHDKSWNISDETLIEGARVAAAYCLYFGLGEPVFGRNIRDHNEFTATGCPVHLQGPRPGNAWGGKAGKYHAKWMAEAVSFYRKLKNKEVHPDGTPISTFTTTNGNTTNTGGDTVTPEQMAQIQRWIKAEAEATRKYTTDFIKGFAGPIGSDVKDVRQQLTGGRNSGEYNGWPQLGDKTVVDALADVLGATTAPAQSLINPSVQLTPRNMLRLIDATVWRIERVVEAQDGAKELVAAAIAADNASKKKVTKNAQ